MSLGPFALISLFYVVLGVRVIYQLARNFRRTFDRNFTHEDRMLVDQAAFFVLLPISVALHELGHAIVIRLYGGEVLDWGFYGFAGYVAFDPRDFTDAQQIVIAAAGTAVNLLLAGIAVALVFLKRPPFRAAINQLLIQFTWISLLNALVVYPLLDIVSGLNGDWTQMYGGGVPALSLVILVIHITVLAALFWAWKSPAMQRALARLTGGSVAIRSHLGDVTAALNPLMLVQLPSSRPCVRRRPVSPAAGPARSRPRSSAAGTGRRSSSPGGLALCDAR